MSLFHLVTTIVVIAALTLTALAALVRIVRGPTILDRMIASDVLLTTLMLAVGSDMALRGHTEAIPMMVGIGATAVLATIVVARYVRRRPIPVTTAAVPTGGESPDSGVGHV